MNKPNKKLAKAFRRVMPGVAADDNEEGKPFFKNYTTPFTCHLLRWGLKNEVADEFYSALYGFNKHDLTFQCALPGRKKPLSNPQAYTARIMALELAALIAETEGPGAYILEE